METDGVEYQSTLDADGGMMEWERQAANEAVFQGAYCEQCTRAVGEDPEFLAAGGVVAGPFCSDQCRWTFLFDEE